MLVLLAISCKQEKEYKLKTTFDCTASSSNDNWGVELVFAGGFEDNKVVLILDDKKIFEGDVTTDELDGVAKYVKFNMRKAGALKIGVGKSSFDIPQMNCPFLIVDLNDGIVDVTGTDVRPKFK